MTPVPRCDVPRKLVLGVKRELADDIISRNFWTHRLIRSFVNLQFNCFFSFGIRKFFRLTFVSKTNVTHLINTYP